VCNNLRDRGQTGHPYKLPHLWPPKSPDLSTINYEIWGIQQRFHSTKMQEVKNLM